VAAPNEIRFALLLGAVKFRRWNAQAFYCVFICAEFARSEGRWDDKMRHFHYLFAVYRVAINYNHCRIEEISCQ
jgi:hypothetical protein